MQSESVSNLLARIAEDIEGSHVRLDWLTEKLGLCGHALLLTLFAAPIALPIPDLPGLTAFFAIPMLFITIQIVLRRETLWLPDWLARKTIKASHLRGIITKSIPLLRRVEKLLHPRMSWLAHKHNEIWLGIVLTIFSISVATPLPFAHTVPSLGIVLISLGLLEKDGLMILGGIVIGSIGLCIAIVAPVLAFMYGPEFIKSIWPW